MKKSILANIIFCNLVFLAKLDAQSLARLNGQEISVKEIDASIDHRPELKSLLVAAKQDPNWKSSLINLRTKALEGYVQQKLLLKAATEDEEVNEAEVDNQLNEEIRKLKEVPQKFQKILTESKISELEFMQKLKEDLLLASFSAKLTEDVFVSEDEIKDLYEALKNNVSADQSTIRVSHILAEAPPLVCSVQEELARQKINDAYEIVQAYPRQFSMIARVYSEARNNRYGGYLGRVRRGVNSREFDEIAFNMKPGEISPPVRTERGYNIIWVIDRAEPEVPSYDNSKERLRAEILLNKKLLIVEDTVLQLLKKSEFVIYDNPELWSKEPI